MSETLNISKAVNQYPLLKVIYVYASTRVWLILYTLSICCLKHSSSVNKPHCWSSVFLSTLPNFIKSKQWKAKINQLQTENNNSILVYSYFLLTAVPNISMVVFPIISAELVKEN